MERSFKMVEVGVTKQGMKQIVDIQHSALLHPYFTLMCNWTTLSIIVVDEVDETRTWKWNKKAAEQLH